MQQQVKVPKKRAVTILDVADEKNPHWASALEAFAHSSKDEDREFANKCMALAHSIRQHHGQRQGQANPPRV